LKLPAFAKEKPAEKFQAASQVHSGLTRPGDKQPVLKRAGRAPVFLQLGRHESPTVFSAYALQFYPPPGISAYGISNQQSGELLNEHAVRLP
jgi:hypothetical protein